MVALNHGTPRFLPDKEKPPRLGARGLFLEGRALVPRDLEIVQDRRTRIEGNPGRPGSSRIVAGAVLLFVANLTLGRWFGPVGLLWGYAVTGAGFMVPFGLYLLQRKRKTCGYPPFKFVGI